NTYHPYLLQFKNKLKKRKIKKFNDDTWYMWGRDFNKSDRKRVYVNNKTREFNPFFTHSCNNYDGSVLALFIKDRDNDEKVLVEMLNKVDWKELGFVCGGRFMFTQKGLQNTRLPSVFEKFVKNKKEVKKEDIIINQKLEDSCIEAIKELVGMNMLFDHLDIITYTRRKLGRNTKKSENLILEYLISKHISKYLTTDYDKLVINASTGYKGPFLQYLYVNRDVLVDTYISKDKYGKNNTHNLTSEKRVQIPYCFIKNLGDINDVIIDCESNPTYILVYGEDNSDHLLNPSILKVNKDVRISSTMMKEKYNFLPDKIHISQDKNGLIKISPQILF
ncbi:MAG: hypothetical protein J7L15_04580, partial [Clostridiales bacterium]|nr:hypothetical protein [Clostridiales bacterium]